MLQRFPSMRPMQLGILQMPLNSSAIRSYSSEVGTAIDTRIGCSTFQVVLPDSRTMHFIVLFPTRRVPQRRK
jgi:hypothetical protein